MENALIIVENSLFLAIFVKTRLLSLESAILVMQKTGKLDFILFFWKIFAMCAFRLPFGIEVFLMQSAIFMPGFVFAIKEAMNKVRKAFSLTVGKIAFSNSL